MDINLEMFLNSFPMVSVAPSVLEDEEVKSTYAEIFSAGFDGSNIMSEDEPIVSGDNMAEVFSTAFGGTPFTDEELEEW